MTTDKRDKIIAWVVIGISAIATAYMCKVIIFPWYFEAFDKLPK